MLNEIENCFKVEKFKTLSSLTYGCIKCLLAYIYTQSALSSNSEDKTSIYVFGLLHLIQLYLMI